MKIAVTSTGESLESQVDPRFGRAAKLVLFDTETRQSWAVDNARNMSLAQGAGIQAASTVSTLGVACLLTGHCGPKAFKVLSAAGVEVRIGAVGTVMDAIERFEAGALSTATAADVEGHW
jgi:predicted Fe-Mo cluster-binding NifX family protein